LQKNKKTGAFRRCVQSREIKHAVKEHQRQAENLRREFEVCKKELTKIKNSAIITVLTLRTSNGK